MRGIPYVRVLFFPCGFDFDFHLVVWVWVRVCVLNWRFVL